MWWSHATPIRRWPLLDDPSARSGASSAPSATADNHAVLHTDPALMPRGGGVVELELIGRHGDDGR